MKSEVSLTNEYYFCKFGDQTVVAEQGKSDGATGTFICPAPETDGAKVVDVAFSLDGISYSKPASKKFAFHEPLTIVSLSPSLGYVGGGSEVGVSLVGGLLPESATEGMLKPTCSFDGLTSVGSFSFESSEVTCTVPSIYTLGHVDLAVSLNGLDYSLNTGNFTVVLRDEWNEAVTKLSTHAVVGDPTLQIVSFGTTMGTDPFYGFYGNFYGGFYGFYEYKFYDFYSFYGPTVDVPYDEQVNELCMTAVSPAVGPNYGGTVVTVKLAGIIPEGQETFFCKFGATTVMADSFYYADDLTPSIVCTAPEYGSGPGAVELKISLDGVTFTQSGAAYFYHDDLKIDDISPSIGGHLGGTTVAVRLSEDPMPSAFKVGSVTVPATCKFDDVPVIGEYVVSDGYEMVLCTSPPSEIGVVDVRVSLNSQQYSNDMVAFKYVMDVNSAGVHEMSVSHYLLETDTLTGFNNQTEFYGFYGFYAYYEFYHQVFDFYTLTDSVPTEVPAFVPEVPKIFDYLPFSPDLCLFFNAGPDTSLEDLEISDGDLSPQFSPSVYAYVAVVAKETTCVKLSAFPTDKNVQKVTVAGSAVDLDSASSCISLNVGENLIDIVVVGQDGTSTRTYSVVVVRLAGTNTALEDILLSSGTLVPEFAQDVLSYTVTVTYDVLDMVLKPIPVDADAFVTVVVDGTLTYFADDVETVSLNFGDNVFEITVESEDGLSEAVYTVLVVREGSSQLSALSLFADEYSATEITLNPAFDSLTLDYTALTSAVATSVYVDFTIQNIFASATVTYTVGNATAACDGNGPGTYSGMSLPLQLCNPRGTNTIDIEVTLNDAVSIYSIDVTRPDANVQLSSLISTAGTFVPPFQEDVTTYLLLIPSTSGQYSLTPTVNAEAMPTVVIAQSGSSQSVSSGTPTSDFTHAICGPKGDITLTLTASDSSTTVIYTVTPIRLAEIEHSRLPSIALANATAGYFDPIFSTAVDGYDLNIYRNHSQGSNTTYGTDNVYLDFTTSPHTTTDGYSSYYQSISYEYNYTTASSEGYAEVDVYTYPGTLDTEYSIGTVLGGFQAHRIYDSLVTIVVESCDGYTSTEYEINIDRLNGTSALLCGLAAYDNDGELYSFDSAFDSDDYTYSMNASSVATSVNFVPILCDAFATLELGSCTNVNRTAISSGSTQSLTLSTDFTTTAFGSIEFCVTSEDGDSDVSYGVSVFRFLGNTAELEDLEVTRVTWDGVEDQTSVGDLDLVVSGNTATQYLAADEPYFKIKPTLSDGATVQVTGTVDGVSIDFSLESDEESGLQPYVEGCEAPNLVMCSGDDNLCPEVPLGGTLTLTLVVTSQDGSTTSTYTLILQRQSLLIESNELSSVMSLDEPKFFQVDYILLVGHMEYGVSTLAEAGYSGTDLTNNPYGAEYMTDLADAYALNTAENGVTKDGVTFTGLLPSFSHPTYDYRFRTVTTGNFSDTLTSAQYLQTNYRSFLNRISSGYVIGDHSAGDGTYGEVVYVELGTSNGQYENETVTELFVKPIWKSPYQTVHVGTSGIYGSSSTKVDRGCGLSIELDYGNNTITVTTYDTLAAEYEVYEINVFRPFADEALLESIMTSIAFDTVFDSETYMYEVDIDQTEEELLLDLTTKVDSSSVFAATLWDGVLQSSVPVGSATSFTLNPTGTTTILATVYTDDGARGAIYTFVLHKVPTLLSSLTVTDATGTALILDPAFLYEEYEYPTTTSYILTLEDTPSTITIDAVPVDSAATVYIGHTVAATGADVNVTANSTSGTSVLVGATPKDIYIDVTGSDGVANTRYTINIVGAAKYPVASNSYVIVPTVTSFAAGEATLDIVGFDASGEAATTGTFTCVVDALTTLAYQESFNSTLVSAGLFRITLDSVVYEESYSYSCSYTCESVQTCASYEPQAIGNGTGTFSITPGGLGDKSVLSIVSTEAVQGQNVFFKITTKDDYGNNVDDVAISKDLIGIYVTYYNPITMEYGQDFVQATFVTDTTINGAIEFYITPDYLQTYVIVATVMTDLGFELTIVGSGLTFTPEAPPSAADDWEVFVNSLPDVVYSDEFLGPSATYEVEGNVYVAGEEQLVSISPIATAAFATEETEIFVSIGYLDSELNFVATSTYSCDDRSTIQCDVVLDLTFASAYYLNVTIADTLVGGKLHPFLVVPNDAVLSHPSTNYVVPSTAPAGTEFDAEVTLFDAYGNQVYQIPNYFEAYFFGLKDGVFLEYDSEYLIKLEADTSEGTFSATEEYYPYIGPFYGEAAYFALASVKVSFILRTTISEVGDYELFLAVNDMVDDPGSVEISAGATDPTATSIFGLQSELRAGDVMDLVGIPRDSFLNQKDAEEVLLEPDFATGLELTAVGSETFTFSFEVDTDPEIAEFVADVNITTAGVYTLYLTLGSSLVSAFDDGSTVGFLTVVAGEADLTQTQIYAMNFDFDSAEALSAEKLSSIEAEVGFSVAFYAAFSDAYGNEVSATELEDASVLYEIDGPAEIEFDTIEAALEQYAFLVWYTTTTGIYTLDLIINGYTIESDTFIKFVPGPASPSLSRIEGLAAGITAGEESDLYVVVVDFFGNTDDSGEAVVEVIVDQISATGVSTFSSLSVEWSPTDGYYAAEFTPILAGDAIVYAYVDGEPLDPQSTLIFTSYFNATTSVVDGAFATVINDEAVLTVQSYDAYGNFISTGGAPIFVRLGSGGTGQQPTELSYSDIGDGTYEITYSFASAGNETLEIVYLDFETGLETLVGGSAITVDVQANSGEFDAASSVLSMDDASSATTSVITGTFVTKDENSLTFVDQTGLLAFGVCVVDATTSATSSGYTALVAHNGDGSYDVNVTITAVGTYNLYVTYNDGSIPAESYTDCAGTMAGSPATIAVVAGAPDYTLTTLVDTLLTVDDEVVLLDVNSSIYLQFTLDDPYGNQLSADAGFPYLSSMSVYIKETITTLAGNTSIYYPLSFSYEQMLGELAVIGTFSYAIEGDVVFVDNTISTSLGSGVGEYELTEVAFFPGKTASFEIVAGPPSYSFVTFAGEIGYIILTASDAFGNEIDPTTFSSCSGSMTTPQGASLPFTCTVDDPNVDSIVLSYNATESGTYSPEGIQLALVQSVGVADTAEAVEISSGEAAVAAFTVPVQVLAGDADPSMSYMVDAVEDTPLTISAGTEETKTVQLLDAFGNAVDESTTVTASVTIDGETTQLIVEPDVTDPSGSTYLFSFGGTGTLITGPDVVVSLEVKLGGEHIKLSGTTAFTVGTVNPAPSDISKSIVQTSAGDLLVGCTANVTQEYECEPEFEIPAGEAFSISLFMYNTLGLRQMYVEDVVTANSYVVSKPTQDLDANDVGLTIPNVAYAGEGEYIITFSANVYESNTAEVTYAIDVFGNTGSGMQDVPVTPVYFSVKPGTAVPSSTTIQATFDVSSKATRDADLALYSHVELITKDKFNNLALYDPENPILITGTVVGPGEGELILEPIYSDAGDITGNYILGVGAQVAGDYFVNLVMNDEAIDTFSITVNAGDLKTDTIFLEASDVVAGSVGAATFKGTDKFGNDVSSSGTFSDAISALGFTFDFELLTDSGTTNGTTDSTVVSPLVLNFLETTTGTLTIVATSNDTLTVVEKQVEVTPGAVSVAKSTTAGPALIGFAENQPTFFTVTLKDENENVLDDDKCLDLAIVGLPSYEMEAAGGCVISFSLPEGFYSVSISIYGELITSASLASTTDIGEIALENTVVSGDGFGDADTTELVVEAGEPATFILSMASDIGILIPESQGASFVTVDIVSIAITEGRRKMLQSLPQVQVTDLGTGSYNVSYVIEAVGTYNMTVMVGEGAEQIVLGSKVLEVFPTETTANDVTFVSDTVAGVNISAGVETTIALSIVDNFGNPQTYDLFDVDPMTLKIADDEFVVSELSEGVYGIQTTFMTAGSYEMMLYFDGSYTGETLPITVIPGAPYIPNSILYGTGLSFGGSGSEEFFFMELYDSVNNLIDVATSADVEALGAVASAALKKISNSSITVDCVLDVSPFQNAIQVTYVGIEKGDYIFAFSDGDVEYTTFAGYTSTSILPGAATAETTVATQVSGGKLAGTVTFQIVLSDINGNTLDYDSGANFFVLAAGTTVDAFAVASSSDVVWSGDRYVVSMSVTTAGIYDLDILLDGVVPIAGSPYTLNVTAGSPDYTQATVSGTAFSNFTVGDTVTAEVVSKDSYGNQVETLTESFELEFRYTTGITTKVPLVASSPGLYSASTAGITTSDSGMTVAMTYLGALGQVDISTATIDVAAKTTISTDQTLVYFTGGTIANPDSPEEVRVYNAGDQEIAALYITPKDEYGNTIQVEDGTGFVVQALEPDGAVHFEATVPEAYQLQGETLALFFNMTIAGDYSGTVQYNDVLIYSESVKVNAADPVFDLTLTDTFPATAGTTGSFAMKFFDAFGNSHETTTAFMSDATISVRFSDTFEDVTITSRAFNGSAYVIDFMSTKTGDVELLYFYDNEQLVVPGSAEPYATTITPGALDLTTTAVEGLDPVSINSVETFNIIPKDSYGNDIPGEQSGSFQVSAPVSSASVSYFSDGGYYIVTLTTGDAASLNLDSTVTESSISIELSYTDGSSAPEVWSTLSTPTFLSAGSVSASTSTIVDLTKGTQLKTIPNTETGMVAGVPVEFAIALKDDNGLAVEAGADKLADTSVTILPSIPSDAVIEAQANPLDGFKVSFTATAVGTYSAQVQYGGSAIQGGAYAGFLVGSNEAVASTSVVSVDGVSAFTGTSLSASAGSTLKVYVIAKDTYGNQIDSGASRPLVTASMLSSDSFGTVQVTDMSYASTPTYHLFEIDAVATKVGTYALDVSLKSAIDGSVAELVGTVTVEVTSAAFAPAKTVVTIPATITAGVSADVLISAYDTYDNVITDPSTVILTAEATLGTTTVSAGATSYLGEDATATHVVSMTFNTFGTYSFAVKKDGTTVATTPAVVSAGPIAESTTTVTGAALGGVTAGVDASFTMVPKDSLGNMNLTEPVITFTNDASDVIDWTTTMVTGVAEITVTIKASMFTTAPSTMAITYPGTDFSLSYALTVDPAPAPAVTAAKMTSVTTIEVTFDQDTDRGGAIADACLAVTDETGAKLGANPTCIFTSASVLSITTGSEATILPLGSLSPDTLEIRPDTVRNSAGNSFAASGGSLIEAPDTLVLPFVNVKAPASVGICEDLVIDASNAEGSGGRAMTFKFEVEGLGSKIQDLTAVLSGLGSTTSIASIDKNSMNFDLTYTFVITVTNFLGQSTSVRQEVFRSGEQVPTIFIASASELSVESGDKVTVPCRAEMPGEFVYDAAQGMCVINTGEDIIPIDFQWTVDKTSATFAVDTLPAANLATMQARDFVIPANFLEAGKTYNFTCTGSDQTNPSLKQSAGVGMSVGYSAYSVAIEDGSRTVSDSEAIVVQAVVNDPNEAVAQPASYTWSTTPDLPQSAQSKLFSDAAITQGTVSFDPNELTAGTYVFTVSAAKSPLTATRTVQTASVTITVTEAKVLAVKIKDNLKGAAAFDTAQKLKLRCVTPEVGRKYITYQWSMLGTDGDTDVAAIALKNSEGKRKLRIRKGKLNPGVSYKFTCEALVDPAKIDDDFTMDDLLNVTGVSSTDIQMKGIPSSGKTILTVDEAGFAGTVEGCDIVEGLGDFSVIAKDWVVTGDAQLFYEFHAINVDTEQDTLLATISSDNTLVFTLAEGTYNLTAYIKTTSASAAAGDAPSGAEYVDSTTLKVCSQSTITDGLTGRRLLMHDAEKADELYKKFSIAIAEGNINGALSQAEIYGGLYGGASRPQTCDVAEDDLKTQKTAILNELITADGNVVASNEYVSMQACAFDSLLPVPGEQDPTTFSNLVQLLNTQSKSIYDGSLDVAAGSGDNYYCYLSVVDKIFGITELNCDNSLDQQSFYSKAVEILGGLGQSMTRSSTEYSSTALAEGSTPFASLPAVLVAAEGSPTTASIAGVISGSFESEDDTAPFMIAAPALDAAAASIVNDAFVLSDVFAIGASETFDGNYTFPTSYVAEPPSGFEVSVKYFVDPYFENGKPSLSEVPEYPEGVSLTADGYLVSLTNVTGDVTYYIVLYAQEIPVSLSGLELFAPQYTYYTLTSSLALNDGNGMAVTLDPPFSPGQRTYSASVSNFSPFAIFKATVAKEGLTVGIRSNGGQLTDVTSATQGSGEYVEAGPIAVHETHQCAPDGITPVTSAYATCAAKTNVYEIVVAKDGTVVTYNITVARAPSTDSDINAMSLVANGVAEPFYDALTQKVETSFNKATYSYASYVVSSVTAANVEAAAVANAAFPYGPGGAHIVVTGAGAIGADALVSWGNASSTVGSTAAESDYILIGRNPVSVVSTSQDGSSSTEYALDVYRMGKGVQVTEKYTSLNSFDFIESPQAQENQNLFVSLKADQLGVEDYQIEILLVSKGSVIIEYVVYPVIETLRDPTATAEEKAATDAIVETANAAGADSLYILVLEKQSEVLDFGDLGTSAGEVTSVALPALDRPEGYQCPVCPVGYETLQTTNADGDVFCSCVVPTKKSDDLGEGEIAGIVIGAVAFVAIAAGASYYVYMKRKKAQEVVGDVEEEEESEEEGEEAEA